MSFSLCILSLLFVVSLLTISRSQHSPQYECTDALPQGWNVPYCPENITRIEYQIDIDSSQLTANGGNTVDQIDLFLEWIIDNFEDDEFLLKTSKIDKYYRNVTEFGQDMLDTLFSLKYRHSFDSITKYQNDLTLEVSLAPRLTFDYTQVIPNINYSHIFEYKIEPNVFIDTCSATNWSNYIYGIDATSFAAKIEFDDDDTIVADINIGDWANALTVDDVFCDDCSSNPCLCCDIEEYLTDFCLYFDSSSMNDFHSQSYVDYVVDIDFKWYRNDSKLSEGKLTFQVQYVDLEAMSMDIPNAHGTEFSLKLYKEDTDDGEWQNVIAFAQDFIDDLVFPTDDMTSNEWLDYSDCVPVSVLDQDTDVDGWFIVSVTVGVLVCIAVFVLCYFVWIYCKKDDKERKGRYHKTDIEENDETAMGQVCETTVQTETNALNE